MLKHILSNSFLNKTNLLLTESILSQQTRNTFILKRKWNPGLHKKNSKGTKLRARHNVYELVEDTTIKRKPDLEVVLTSFVDGIGNKGDVVSLRPNFAYNKLLLPGLAVYNTPENVEKYKRNENEIAEQEHSSPFASRTVNMLNRLLLPVTMNKDHPWVIEPWHIRACLRKAGYYAAEECIKLPDTPITGPDLKKENKEFFVTITVNNLEQAKVRCRIHHWSTDPLERLPYVFEHWKEPAEPLFGLEKETKE